MHRIRAWAHEKAYGPPPRSPIVRTTSNSAARTPSGGLGGEAASASANHANVSQTESPEGVSAPNDKAVAEKPNVAVRFARTTKSILLSSFVNILLVFVPVGIAAHFAHLSAGVVFAMNAIAIIPLAGLLSHATESVASRLGDTIGALMNVTFGNAVELIIFIIALVKNEIRIVQASLVGSILANLLLILGMCFLLGGLRYREQIYNSTVTQMSACLLSLSVSSLLLPTAFHASFSNSDLADRKVLQVSRGTSVVLLLVYLLYLLFQLNSHAYMYESTPQAIIERESLPGPAAGYFNSSSSSESSSSSSDSSDSDQSNSTARRIKRALKRSKNKKNSKSASSADNNETPISQALPETAAEIQVESTEPATADPGIVADDEEEETTPEAPRRKRKHKHHKKRAATSTTLEDSGEAGGQTATGHGTGAGQVRRVDFAMAPDVEAQTEPRSQPFSLRTLANPSALSKTLSVNVFNTQLQRENSAHEPSFLDTAQAQSARPRPQLRRTASEPADNRSYAAQPGAFPPIIPVIVNRTPKTIIAGEEDEAEPEISRTTAILLLLVSTGLVALCAEFMVDSINEVVADGSGVSEAFIGLILLPIVGNAAEHVTGITVAMKNKMDLAIGVALGSSIQIAIFVTPLVVILGWCMNKDMSLYFTLFETVSMFVSAFIVNFLVLDGRSNYLEGALLCSAYVIIAVAAFFYPNAEAANSLGGGDGNTTDVIEAAKLLVRGMLN